MLGLPRKPFTPPPPLPGFKHPSSSPGLTLNLKLSLQALLDYADLELGAFVYCVCAVCVFVCIRMWCACVGLDRVQTSVCAHVRLYICVA